MTYDLTDNERIKVSNPQDLYPIMQSILLREDVIDQDREHLWVVSLASNRMILNIERIAIGSVKAVVVEPMEVFSFALTKRARSIILVHNHPSGELSPSKADKQITDRIYQSGLILGTPLEDHLIITPTSFYSFSATGLLKEISKSLDYKPPYVALDEGLQKGIEKGIEKGIKKRTREIARTMKAEGVPIDQIMRITGLTKQQVRNLKI